MSRMWFGMAHQKDNRCSLKIGLRVQNMIIILGSLVNQIFWGGPLVHWNLFVSNGVSKQESRFRVSGFVVVVHAQRWTTLSLVQTKKKNAAFYPSLKWRSWFSFKWTWGCGRAMGTDNAMQGLNHDEMDITKVPSLPSRLEIKDQDYFLYEERALHLNVCHANKNLRIWIKIWPCQLQQMNLNFMKPLLLTKAFLTRAIWSQYIW